MADDEKRPEAQAGTGLDDKDLEDVAGGRILTVPQNNVLDSVTGTLTNVTGG
jgi:hypothetical protein